MNTSPSIRPKRRWSRVAATTAAGFLIGAVGTSVPALAAAPSTCLRLWHTSGITTQTEYGRNDCRSGRYGFKVHSWSRFSSETSPCLSAAPGQTVGWKWTRGRSNFEVIGC